MHNLLNESIEKLGVLFPQIDLDVSFSNVLSKDEISVFSSVVQDKSNICDCSVFSIKKSDVDFVGSVLALSYSGESKAGIVDFLSRNPAIRDKLSTAYYKILNYDLVGSFPVIDSWPSVKFKKVFQFNEFNKLLHNVIHYVLEKNGLASGDFEFDEALVTFLHQEVSGKLACSFHYTGKEGRSYLRLADFLRENVKDLNRVDVVPYLREFLSHNLEKQGSFRKPA